MVFQGNLESTWGVQSVKASAILQGKDEPCFILSRGIR